MFLVLSSQGVQYGLFVKFGKLFRLSPLALVIRYSSFSMLQFIDSGFGIIYIRKSILEKGLLKANVFYLFSL
jgi:hypothetical protein